MHKSALFLITAAMVAVPATAAAGGYQKPAPLTVTAEPAGANCANGGIKVDVPAKKTPPPEVIVSTRIQQEQKFDTFYVCNGAPGAAGINGVAGANGTSGTDGAQAPSCTSKRTFGIRIREPKGHQLSDATVTANGKTVQAHRKHNGRLIGRADFTGVVAQKGQIVPVFIQGTDHGKAVSAVRLYRLCTPNAGVLNLPIVL